MKHSFQKFIQVAGVIDKTESDMLQRCGVNYLGFPLRLPVNKEDLSEAEAAEIIKNLEPPFYGVLITYLNKADEIINFCNYLGADIVQLHGDISKEELSRLKKSIPAISVIKSLVIGEKKTSELKNIITELDEFIDAYITDTFDPSTGASGATGKIHDWSISRELISLTSKPVILAGGLNPDNVQQAILEVKPAGVDAHTGVEGINGRKDEAKVRKFVEESLKGFDQIR